jgi:hypothetical protein
MYYNQLNQWEGIPMPLLMGFMNPEKIQEADNELQVIYDPVSQTAFDMLQRQVGTKSLRTSNTGGKPDKKNEIDDVGYVKC